MISHVENDNWEAAGCLHVDLNFHTSGDDLLRHVLMPNSLHFFAAENYLP